MKMIKKNNAEEILGKKISAEFTVHHIKGGVGKTTFATTISIGLAARGWKVLLIDTDSSANATSSLGLSRNESIPTKQEPLAA